MCSDIVDHFLTYVAPLGQKAQVVAYNQKLVVAYAHAIEAELERGSAVMPDGRLREVGVVMHVADSKDTPKEHRHTCSRPSRRRVLKRQFSKRSTTQCRSWWSQLSG